MSSVQFEENYDYTRNSFSGDAKGSKGLVKLVIKTGLVKDEEQANVFLIGIVILIIAISIFILYMNMKTPSIPPPDQIIWVAGPKAKP